MGFFERLLGRAKREAKEAPVTPPAAAAVGVVVTAAQATTPSLAPSAHPTRRTPPGLLQIRARADASTRSQTESTPEGVHGSNGQPKPTPSKQLHTPTAVRSLPDFAASLQARVLEPISPVRPLPRLVVHPESSPAPVGFFLDASTCKEAPLKRNAETAATIEAPAPAEVWTHTGRPQTVPQEAPEEWLDDLLENLGASFDAIVERPIVNPAQDVNDSGESVRSSASPSEPGVAWSFDADNAGGDSGSPKPTPDEERSGAAAEHPEDAKVVQALFYDIASNYLRPYHHFVAALRRGQARGEWIQIARPALENIHRAARDLGIDRLGPLLSSLISLLARLEDEAGAIVKDADGLSILEIHDALVLEAPDAFQIDVAADEGQAFVVHALLSSIPGVGRVTIDRLYRVGLVAVELIVLASPDDLVLTTGIRRDLADQIVQRFRQHQSETAGLSEERVRAAGISELRELLVRLVRTHADYESAAATHAPQAKLKARQARQALLNRTHLILGRLGEAEFASGLEKLSFERRIEELQRFTSHA